MYKKIGIGLLFTVLFYVVAFYIASQMFDVIQKLSSYRELDTSYMQWSSLYILFGLVLGLPWIFEQIKKEGTFGINMTYISLPIIFFILSLLPLITKEYFTIKMIGILAMKGFYFMPFVFIVFGYSLTLLVKREQIE